MSPTKILVVDDDRNLVELLKMTLESANCEATAVLNEKDAIGAVKENMFDLSIVDLQLGQEDGIALMEAMHLLLPDMPVIILTGHGSIESAVQAIKRGAYSYLTKPFDTPDLLLEIEKALENRRLTTEIRRLKGLLDEKYGWGNIVAKSEKMRDVLEVVGRIARTESTVYVHGESGTGKELIAKAIHLASDRKDKDFVAINCAAIPETLLESKLFGHEKGSFTGAIRSARGLFSQAHEGTLFLDEIGDMSLGVQSKLLRVLQERKFYPVGSEKIVEVDVRLIVATNKDLEEQVKQALFREDLYYRIHVIPIHIPPLRERKEDIPPLVEHFIKKYGLQMNKEVKGLTPLAMQKLLLYDWPGNVRELENTIEYAMAMAEQEFITEDFVLKKKVIAPQQAMKSLKEARDAFEKAYLIHLLELCQGNVSQAAKLAGKHRTDFYDILKRHDLNIRELKKQSKP